MNKIFTTLRRATRVMSFEKTSDTTIQLRVVQLGSGQIVERELTILPDNRLKFDNGSLTYDVDDWIKMVEAES